jgi:hypothetical protein
VRSASFLCCFILAFTGTVDTQADEACDKAYADLRKFEADTAQEMNAYANEGLKAITEGRDFCDRSSIEREKSGDRRRAALAVFARAFVKACSKDPARAQDVSLYALPGYSQPRPTNIDRVCQDLGR